MKRIDLIYNGTAYTVANRSLAEFRTEVDTALAAPTPQWITVNYGEGRVNSALILVTPYTALTIITNDVDDATTETG
ncbi:hypothetical protein C5C31_09340 [Rathayibacter rathayi]|uniref:Uncharacterized protein n=1 Tax=Rathayibacter rathayi TaxID=33887 RepID=A0ABD6W4P3_RATRA|nr:hypothetical protein [Rathayibacter rathayi]AZZ49884.1 hypothetical protein C1O28_12395 [Rathayibacter rathayi]MWV75955.1 hypothetical protein [Rathayibacter rathayi NCPPB 2980 = VKM Ac-1601]PPF09578.1 hypothetical protein C5C04_14625 [Rathayibacter rathayi]PPF18157.1 hypothetical protein C5C34_15555 [Rathayibacter rathayi]PPF41683.1 hypothetical protein C5C08_15920 [Rathayibacter rathayi]